MTDKLNSHGRSLVASLHTAQQHVTASETARHAAETVHIVGAGGTLTAAYEQLRNAAEYAEEHMLLQRAIARFYRRLFLLRDEGLLKHSGEELAVELTLAGYLPNDSIPEATVGKVSRLAKTYYTAHRKLERKRSVSLDDVDQWTVRSLAVEVEWLLSDTSITQSYVQFAYDYFLGALDFKELFDGKEPADKETALYVAIHQALLKSDLSVVRLALLHRYQQSPADLEAFIHANREIDKLFASPTTEKLYRAVDRLGAPLRVLRHMIDHNDTVDQLLQTPDAFLAAFENQVQADYQTINHRINNGIVRSVIFLIITKFIIGIAIEVPYDYAVRGRIEPTPLLINLLFPPVYMILLRMTLVLPGRANTNRLVGTIEQIMYGNPDRKQLRRRASFGSGYNIAYGLIFVLVFGAVAAWLWLGLGFELLHLVIFFVFLSAASFLGFRLSRLIREIEAVDSQQNAITLLRDFLYMPFVVVGRYMNEKYAKVNIVALVLDMLIELPLKTVLRLIRQWSAFISSKKDQL